MKRTDELNCTLVAGVICQRANLDDETPTSLGTPGRVTAAFVRAVSLGVATIDDILGLVDLAPEHLTAALKRMALLLMLADLWVAGGAMDGSTCAVCLLEVVP
mgnify:CR=1 FL=1